MFVSVNWNKNFDNSKPITIIEVSKLYSGGPISEPTCICRYKCATKTCLCKKTFSALPDIIQRRVYPVIWTKLTHNLYDICSKLF